MSLFINPETLDHNYIPEKLPTREAIRKEILDEILMFYRKSTRSYRGMHIFGGVGSGKTVLSRRIGRDLENTLGDEIIVCYVNCRFSRRIYRVLAEIARQISDILPQRGLSKDEFIELIFTVANEKANNLMIIMDELDSLFWGQEGTKTTDVLYLLSRFAERSSRNYNLRLLILSISRTQSFIYKWLDPSTRASFIHGSKYLKPYNSEDLFTILKYRAELAFKHGAVGDDILNFIADFVSKQAGGNARIAIDLLRISGEIAESQQAAEISPKHLRLAIRERAALPSLDIETLLALKKQKLILLLSIIEALKTTNRSYVTRQEVSEFYRELCQEYDEVPRKNTQMWRYLRELEYELSGLLDVSVSGKNQKGRSSRIMINAPLDELERKIRMLLKNTYGYDFH